MPNKLMGFLKEKEIKFTEYEDIAKLSYMKLGDRARLSLSPKNETEFCELISFLESEKIHYKVVGKMSNILPPNDFYDGVLIKTSEMKRKSVAENKVCAECGATLSEVIWYCARINLGGAEELFMIPGTLGGAVYNNAGAYGKTLSDILLSARLYSPSDDSVVEYSRDEMLFSYRNSLLQHRTLYLLSASLRFERSDFADIKDKIRALAEKRRTAQPIELPSLGSIFKRYNGVSAGYYIDKAGLKGYRIGGAEISEKHAGFIVNRGGATPNEVKELIEFSKKRVNECFGITLEEEIEIM